MAKYINAGDSIECSTSCIITRKLSNSAQNYLKIEKDGGGFVNVFKYKTKIRATVKIVSELAPKTHIICQSSKLDVHDELEGETIEIYTDKKVKLELTSNFTNVHGIQGNTIKTFTYAKIAIPFRFALQRAIVGI